MAHFAHINKDGIVDRVLVIDEANLATGNWGDPSEFVQTSYNCYEGEYKLGSTKIEKDSNKLLGTEKDITARGRKHYAGIGFTYDKVNDMFVPPKPYPSWMLDKETAQWRAPKARPGGYSKSYDWNESLLDWVVIS